MPALVPTLNIDPFSDQFLGDPYPDHEALREAGPVVWLEKYEIFASARHAEVQSALQDRRTFSSAAGVGLADFRKEKPFRPPSLVLEADPPLHERTRPALALALSPSALRDLRPTFEVEAHALVDRLVSRGAFDGVTDLAEVYPIHVFADALGLCQDGRENLLPYAAMLFNAFGPRNRLFEETLRGAEAAREWVMKQCDRAALRPESLGARVFATADRGEVSEEEAGLLVRSLLSAGLDTTVYALGNALFALATHPEAWIRLRAQPDLARGAFEEALRFESSVQTRRDDAIRLGRPCLEGPGGVVSGDGRGEVGGGDLDRLTRRAFAGSLPTAAGVLMAAGASADPAQEAAFEAIWSAEWAWRQKEYPDDSDPEREIAPYLPDDSAAAQARRLAVWRDVLAQLARVDTAKLDDEGRIDFAVYRYQIEAIVASQAWRDWEAPLNSDTTFWGQMTSVCQRTFRTEANYRNYIAQLRQTPRWFSDQIANMKAGLARGFTPPKVTLQGRDASAAAIADAASPQATIFYKPFETMPEGFTPALSAELRAEGMAVIGEAVIPAHRTLLAFLRADYIPRARASIDAYSLPDGPAYYRSKIAEFTTLELSPGDIHAIGLSEIASIRQRMAAVMAEVKFDGDLSAFFAFLRTDPRFYVTTPQALLDRAAWIAKTFDGKAADWFGRLPRARFAIRPVPAEMAPFYTAGRGGPGVYLVNTYDLPSRPLYSLTALTLHESAPGHAFQMPLSAETEGQPEFRRKSYISAYGEGWALYCETLGEEMGMYETPYERFGMLSYQAWRAARLVVDTGVHAMGWPRDRAIAYLRDNTALSEHEVGTEIDRYISWPAQALSYYLGEMAILKARAKAQAALGPKFEIRAFHDTVLQIGSVPLPVLTARIDRFIAEGGASPYPAQAA